jgi:hypothetical protein
VLFPAPFGPARMTAWGWAGSATLVPAEGARARES